MVYVAALQAAAIAVTLAQNDDYLDGAAAGNGELLPSVLGQLPSVLRTAAELAAYGDTVAATAALLTDPSVLIELIAPSAIADPETPAAGAAKDGQARQAAAAEAAELLAAGLCALLSEPSVSAAAAAAARSGGPPEASEALERLIGAGQGGAAGRSDLEGLIASLKAIQAWRSTADDSKERQADKVRAPAADTSWLSPHFCAIFAPDKILSRGGAGGCVPLAVLTLPPVRAPCGSRPRCSPRLSSSRRRRRERCCFVAQNGSQGGGDRRGWNHPSCCCCRRRRRRICCSRGLCSRRSGGIGCSSPPGAGFRSCSRGAPL